MCMYVYMYVCVWDCGVVVSMFDFHRSDRGSNPGRGGEFFIMIPKTLYSGTIRKCLKTICHGFTQAMRGKLGRWKLFGSPSVADLARCEKLS